MKQSIRAGLAALVAGAAVVSLSASAQATSFDEQVALCAAALDDQGIAAAADYRPKFQKSKGGAVKRVTVKFVPTIDDAETIEAECRIRGGEVVDVSVKA